jgi:hypothetical protein
MALDQTRANQILDAIHGVATLTATTAPIKLRLMTGATINATTNGTEIAASAGYTALGQTITMGSASAGSSSNSLISWTNMPATAVIHAIEIWDSNGTPKRQLWGILTADKATALGDTLSFSAAAITSALT